MRAIVRFGKRAGVVGCLMALAGCAAAPRDTVKSGAADASCEVIVGEQVKADSADLSLHANYFTSWERSQKRQGGDVARLGGAHAKWLFSSPTPVFLNLRMEITPEDGGEPAVKELWSDGPACQHAVVVQHTSAKKSVQITATQTGERFWDFLVWRCEKLGSPYVSEGLSGRGLSAQWRSPSEAGGPLRIEETSFREKVGMITGERRTLFHGTWKPTKGAVRLSVLFAHDAPDSDRAGTGE